MSEHQSQFIVIDGVNHAECTAFSLILTNWLQGLGIACVQVSDPGGGIEDSERILEIIDQSKSPLKAQSKLMIEFALRRVFLDEVVAPNLNNSKWVVCDGFIDSTYAEYPSQGLVTHRDILSIETMALTGCVMPDLVLIIDTPLSIAHKKAIAAAANSHDVDTLIDFEHVQRTFYQKMRTEYLIRSTAQASTHVVIDGSEDTDAMMAELKAIVASHFPDVSQAISRTNPAMTSAI
jgi:dTMP kinase